MSPLGGRFPHRPCSRFLLCCPSSSQLGSEFRGGLRVDSGLQRKGCESSRPRAEAPDLSGCTARFSSAGGTPGIWEPGPKITRGHSGGRLIGTPRGSAGRPGSSARVAAAGASGHTPPAARPPDPCATCSFSKLASPASCGSCWSAYP